MTRLGINQLDVLQTLAGHFDGYHERPFRAGCGWTMGGWSLTVRILQSLTRLGLAEQTPGRSEWKITDAGRDELALRSPGYAAQLAAKRARAVSQPQRPAEARTQREGYEA